VFDVVDANGDVKVGITKKAIIKKEKPIIFPDQARNVIRAYLAVMENRSPILIMKRKTLFPTYNDERTLRRHWDKVYTTFSEIREGGMISYCTRRNRNSEPLLPIYIEGSKIYRISPRQYYAVIANKKILSGKDVNDNRCIVKMLESWEQIQKIDRKSPSARKDAANILFEANESFKKIQKTEHHDSYKSLIDHISNMAKGI